MLMYTSQTLLSTKKSGLAMIKRFQALLLRNVGFLMDHIAEQCKNNEIKNKLQFNLLI